MIAFFLELHRESTSSYGKLKLVLRHNTLFVETAMEYKALLNRILQDPDVAAARVHSNMIDLGGDNDFTKDGFTVRKAEAEDEENMAYKVSMHKTVRQVYNPY